ncbi:hypothetical protein DPMN_127623 [Dreissena polymorpha]|uniref:Uncharacterized protein n=1 Tax=Dreissena polymorpha TaxID=45954 RepID=A0A9D4JYZ0_DREPO|nr:hypothetical protein DPMN_127623 [Dreissena polymorpha]
MCTGDTELAVSGRRMRVSNRSSAKSEQHVQTRVPRRRLSIKRRLRRHQHQQCLLRGGRMRLSACVLPAGQLEPV